MMNKYKKVVLYLFIISFVFIPINTFAASKAKTLAELRAELSAWKKEQSDNEKNKTATKNEISNAKTSVSNKQSEIISNQQKVQDAITESAQLEVEIEEGKTKLSDLMKSYQLASGNNAYYEYIFEAESYEDLIYRYSVMKQIMDYQEKTITEYKNKIESNNQLKIELEQREIQLNEQIDSLSKQISSLNTKLSDYMDISMDIKDEISSTQELINYYEKIGCKEDQNLDECVRVLGDTGFIKPTTKGVTTSLFGYRTHPVTGVKNKFHSGIDIGGNKEGTAVYSVANGMVGKIIKKASCGGNQVYIYHTINGKLYTSAYLHLLSINVSVGDRVTNQTVIGTVGGGSGTKSYDSCSTGAHLHFGLGTGWYGSTYTAYSKWVANLIDPQPVLKFPELRKYYYTRTG